MFMLTLSFEREHVTAYIIIVWKNILSNVYLTSCVIRSLTELALVILVPQRPCVYCMPWVVMFGSAFQMPQHP